jgi:uncharacterized protein YjbJ (UPF0337 family)
MKKGAEERGILPHRRMGSEGAAKPTRGAVKEAVGQRWSGDAKLQAEGKAEQAGGKLQNAVGG